MRRGPLLSVAAAFGGFALLHAACKDAGTPPACVDIPTNGCPEDDGVDVCSDPTCGAAYSCQNGKWVFDKSCPGFEAGVVDAGMSDHESGARDVAVIDAPPGAYGGPGCVDLQPPDCPLGAVLNCKQSDCCGCTDLFVCMNMGWNLWGTCADGGLTPGQ